VLELLGPKSQSGVVVYAHNTHMTMTNINDVRPSLRPKYRPDKRLTSTVLPVIPGYADCGLSCADRFKPRLAFHWRIQRWTLDNESEVNRNRQFSSCMIPEAVQDKSNIAIGH